jgi:ATP/maltotriose-dependent transcriptional regulator MalT
VQKAFEETVELYYNIDVLNDSDDEIPLPPYLERAMVMYVQARISEDRGEMDKYEYLMARFHKMVEKHESSKVWGARMLSSGYHAIR